MKLDKKTALTQIKGHVKAVAGIVVGVGVGEIIGCAVKEYKPDAKGFQKLIIKIGAIALTGMVVKAATDYANSSIDDAFETAEDIFTKAKLAACETTSTDGDEGMEVQDEA